MGDNMETNKSLQRYRKHLLDAGYSAETIVSYFSTARAYVNRNGEPNMESAKKYIADRDIKSMARRTGLMKYIEFMTGKAKPKRIYTHRKKISLPQECDHDCFNCKYDDCLYP
jgi:hypothetical protein